MASIFDVKPNVVSRNLSGKSFLFYGERKSGKTTNACRFPKHILLGFEKGWGLIPGANALPINSWREALSAKKELVKDAEAVAKGEKDETTFQTVIVDTADIAYDYCEKYILMKEGVDYLDETESKRGYRAVSLEYDAFFQDIVKAGYTLVCISHATSKQVKEAGEKYDKTIPTISNRGFLVISRLVDVCAYASYETDEEGNTTPMLTMRGNKYLEAGSRNEFMSEKIPFTYEALRDDMAQAVVKLEKKYKVKATDDQNNLFLENEDKYKGVTFDQARSKIREYAMAMHDINQDTEYNELVARYLGRGHGVKEAEPSQLDMLLLILDELSGIIDAGTVVPLGKVGKSTGVAKKTTAKAKPKAVEPEPDEDEAENEEVEETDDVPEVKKAKATKTTKTSDNDELNLDDDEEEEVAPKKKTIGRPRKKVEEEIEFDEPQLDD